MTDNYLITEIVANKFGVTTRSIEILYSGRKTCGINHPNLLAGRRILNNNPETICAIFTIVNHIETNVAYAIIDTTIKEIVFHSYIDNKKSKSNFQNTIYLSST